MAQGNSFYPLITAAAERTGLPWWLIYGVIEQESGFDPNSRSSCGALGLMQLMPGSFPGQTPAALLDPATNIKLGCAFLQECIGIWKQESADEAIKFGLASYNGGAGYVLQAQRQAVAAGEDGSQWTEVEWYLASARVNGKRPDVEQICDYVSRIWRRFAERRMRPAVAVAA